MGAGQIAGLGGLVHHAYIECTPGVGLWARVAILVGVVFVLKAGTNEDGLEPVYYQAYDEESDGPGPDGPGDQGAGPRPRRIRTSRPACGAPREADAVRCAFCGWNFESEAAAVREEYTPDIEPAATAVESLPPSQEIQPVSQPELQQTFQNLAEEAPVIGQTARRVWPWVVVGIVAILGVSCLCCAALGYFLFYTRSSQ